MTPCSHTHDSITIRPTEQEGIYALVLGGQVDYAKVVAEREELERVLEVGTGRKDMKLLRVRAITEWKYVYFPCSHLQY